MTILKNVRLLDGDGSLQDIQWISETEYSITKSESKDLNLNPQRDNLSSPSISDATSIDAKGSILIPGGLVHPHLHLDKCFLLDKTPIRDGTFQEALRETGKAKSSFELEDIVARGRRLLTTSLSHGATTIRAHLEVDPTVKLLCLSAGQILSKEFSERLSLNLVAFAQDPIFYPSNPSKQSEMKELLEEAVKFPEIKVLGSTPYVEETVENSRKNIDLSFSLARENGLDLDFHLDYDLSKEEALLWYVLKVAKSLPKWKIKSSTSSKDAQANSREYRITIGHCTKLCHFSSFQFDQLKQVSEGVNISFVSLPTSDLYMQARDLEYGEKVRSTLPGFELLSRGLRTSLGVNNVGNLFTPHGDADPLALLPLMVSIWQGAREEDMKGLLEMVTKSASYSAGSSESPDYSSATLIDGCKDLQSVVLAPTFGRSAIYKGKLVSRRTVNTVMK